MRIGILTFHIADNYGAVLQAVALQNFLKKNEQHTVKIIDYRNRSIVEQSALITFKRGFKFLGVSCIMLIPNLIRKIKFWKFRYKYMDITRKYDENNIVNSNSEFDFFIVGSDQVWNFSCIDNDLNYFLKFVKKEKKRMAYAASFGNSDELVKIPIAKSELEKFDKISIREDFGNSLLKKYQVVLDPVFLLNAAQWKKLMRVNEHKMEEYILVYTVMVPNKLMDVVKKYSRKYNLPVIYINNWIRYNDFKKKTMVSPKQFINYIYNAKYVFTTSFHATAFSIIFNKNFKVELSNASQFNYRINNLIEKFGLECANIKYEKEKYNWDYVNHMLEEERTNSQHFLLDALL